MKLRFARIGGVLVVVAALVAAPGIAQGAQTSAAPSAEIEQQIEALPIDSLQTKTEAIVDQRQADGGDVQKVSYTPFVATKAELAPGADPDTEVSLAAAPGDCGFSTILTSTPGRVTQDVVASCTKTVWSSHTLNLQMTATNPYNVLDSDVVKTGSAQTTAKKSMIATIFYRCAKTAVRHFNGSTRSYIRVDTTTYSMTGGDNLLYQNCSP